MPTGTGAEMEKGRGKRGGHCGDTRRREVAGGKEVKCGAGEIQAAAPRQCGEDPLEPPRHERTSKLGNAQGPSGQRPGDFSYNSLAKAETRKAR